MLNYLTTGESHGHYMAAILEGMPSGLGVEADFIQRELARRQQGYGRGGRQKIETDRVEILGGILKGRTTGAPVGFLLTNQDFKIDQMPELERPRPGHADLVGALKYDQGIRPVLERASARETVMRVAVGALCKLLLKKFSIEILSHVVRIGSASISKSHLRFEDILKGVKGSEVHCADLAAEEKMKSAIDEARRRKDSLGGIYEVRVKGLPIGLGSYAHFERKLDGRLAQILMSMQSVKAVEIGDGVRLAEVFGSEAHDEIFYDASKGYFRKTNHAGGLEGGVTNGCELVLRAVMKPISTLGRPLASVNMKTKRAEKADFERSDICAVPAGAVIGEALTAFTIAQAFLDKFGGDSIREIRRNYEGYLQQIHE